MAENVGVTPPDYTTLAGQVRVLVGDTDATALTPPEVGKGEYSWYSDAELVALGDLMDGNPKRVAIWVLSQVVVSEVLMLKKWKTDDLQVDGPAIAQGLERTIARLAAEVEAEDAGLFEIVGGVEFPKWLHPEASLYPSPWFRG